MSDPVWDARLKVFLQKTGEELKRFSGEVKAEADRLLAEVQDPRRQQRVRETMEEMGSWAKRTADEVSQVVDEGLKRAETVLKEASRQVTEFVSRPTVPDPDAPSGAPAPVPSRPPPAPAAKARAKKSVGPSPRTRRAAPARKAVKKTVGKKR